MDPNQASPAAPVISGPAAVFTTLISLVQKGDTAGTEALLSSTDPAVVRAIINNGLSQEWFKYGPQGETALHIACRRNDMDTVRVLISHGASCSVLNSVKRTPLEVCSPQNVAAISAVAESNNPQVNVSAIKPSTHIPIAALNPEMNPDGTFQVNMMNPNSSDASLLEPQKVPDTSSSSNCGSVTQQQQVQPAPSQQTIPPPHLPPMPMLQQPMGMGMMQQPMGMGMMPRPMGMGMMQQPMGMGMMGQPMGMNMMQNPQAQMMPQQNPQAQMMPQQNPQAQMMAQQNQNQNTAPGPVPPSSGVQEPAQLKSPECPPAKNATEENPPKLSVSDKAKILQCLKDFGVSLFYDGTEPAADADGAGAPAGVEGGAPAGETGKGHSRFREVPQSLQDVLTVIETRAKNEKATTMDLVRAMDNFDRSQAAGEEFTSLVELINAQNKMLEAYDGISTQALMDTLIMYFEMLPGPVVPLKYYNTLVYVANVQSSRGVMAQSRILFNYLPTISRLLLVRFGTFFYRIITTAPEPTQVLDGISMRFFKYFFRSTDAISPDFKPSSNHHAFLLEELYANAFLRNIQYVTLQVDQPDITSIRHPDDKQVTVGDIVLFAVTLYEFTNPSAGKNTLTFGKNERIRLVNLHKNDWLEGMLNKKRGFLPKAYVKLILHNNPPSRLKTVPGMPALLNTGAAAQVAAKPAAVPVASPMNPMMMMMMQQQQQQQPQQPQPQPQAQPQVKRWDGTDQHAAAGAAFGMNPMMMKNPQWDQGTNPGMMMGMNAMAPQRGMMYNQGMMNPMMMNPSMMGMGAMGQNPGGMATDMVYQQQMEQLRLAQEQLVQQQMQMQMQLQMQQVKLARREQELEAKAKMDGLKKDTLNWQINYDELELEQKIGEGGFGEVYRAKWRGTVVAVKALKHKGPSTQFSADEAERYKREVSILRALNHPNLVLFLGACLTPRLCMISEFMFGGSLYDLLYKKKKIPDHTKRCVLASDIAKAMAFLHNHKPPIVHRDLKSLNILLDEKGEHAKVGDVGLAVGNNKGELKGAVGTYSWMPPEMMKGQTYTEKADVYSYGLVLYEMCTGKLPFAGMPPQQISLRVAVYNERPPLPSSLNSKWRDLITACWGADDAKRPSFISILDVLGAIEKR